jgi:hypothetical protein
MVDDPSLRVTASLSERSNLATYSLDKALCVKSSIFWNAATFMHEQLKLRSREGH